jgi:hypothetical protein
MSRILFRLLLIPIAILPTSSALAQDKPTPPDGKQIRAWIEALANKQPPRRFEMPDEQLTGAEKGALKPVKEAYYKLTQHFLVALPYLVESIDDKRFSYPSEHPLSGVFENRNVGNACQSIIERKLMLGDVSVRDERDFSVRHSLPIGKTWYARVKGMSLFEMQVDTLDWVLEQPPPNRVKQGTWNEALVSLRAFRKDFVAKGLAEDRTFGPAIEGK